MRFFSLFLLSAFLLSCSLFSSSKRYNTEIVCSDGTRVLVRFARMDEVRDAIYEFYQQKREQRTSEGYTKIKLKDDRSLKIERIPPERMIKNCLLTESPVGLRDPNYVHKFQPVDRAAFKK